MAIQIRVIHRVVKPRRGSSPRNGCHRHACQQLRRGGSYMRKSGIRLALFSLAVAAIVIAATRSADARPKYNEVFAKKYAANAAAVGEKCAVCHIGKPNEKKWNDYGTA